MAKEESNVKVAAKNGKVDVSVNVTTASAPPPPAPKAESKGNGVPSIADMQKAPKAENDLNKPAPKPAGKEGGDEKTLEVLNTISNTLLSLQDSTISMKTEIVSALQELSPDDNAEEVDYVTNISDALVESFANRNLQMNLTDTIINTIIDTKFQGEFVKILKEGLDETIATNDYFISNSEKASDPGDSKEVMESIADGINTLKDLTQNIQENTIPIENLHQLEKITEAIKDIDIKNLNVELKDEQIAGLNETLIETNETFKDSIQEFEAIKDAIIENSEKLSSTSEIIDSTGKEVSADNAVGPAAPDIELNEETAEEAQTENTGTTQAVVDAIYEAEDLNLEKLEGIDELISETKNANDEIKNAIDELDFDSSIEQLKESISAKIDEQTSSLERKAGESTSNLAKGDQVDRLTDASNQTPANLKNVATGIDKLTEETKNVTKNTAATATAANASAKVEKPKKTQVTIINQAPKGGAKDKKEPDKKPGPKAKPAPKEVKDNKKAATGLGGKAKLKKPDIKDTKKREQQIAPKAKPEAPKGDKKPAKKDENVKSSKTKENQIVKQGLVPKGKPEGPKGKPEGPKIEAKKGGAKTEPKGEEKSKTKKVAKGAVKEGAKGAVIGAAAGAAKGALLGGPAGAAAGAAKGAGLGAAEGAAKGGAKAALKKDKKPVGKGANGITAISKTNKALTNNKDKKTIENNKNVKQIKQITAGKMKDTKKPEGLPKGGKKGGQGGGVIGVLTKILTALSSFVGIYKATANAAKKDKLFASKFGKGDTKKALPAPKKAAGGMKKTLDFTKMIMKGVLGAFGKLKIMMIAGLIALGLLIWAWVQTTFGGDWIKFFKWLWDKVVWLGEQIMNLAIMLAEWLGPMLVELFSKIGQWFADIGKKLWKAITDTFKSVVKKIKDGFKNLINSIWTSIKNFFKKILNGIKNLFNPKKLLDGLPKVVKKFIPGFETGGKVTGGPEKGDKILIRANAGEYVFNKGQMDRLGELLKDKGSMFGQKKLTHDEVFKLANTPSGLKGWRLRMAMDKGRQKFADGGPVLPERTVVEPKVINYTSFVNNMNRVSASIDESSLKLSESSNLLLNSLKNSLSMADNKTTDNSNTMVNDKLNKTVQTNVDSVNVNQRPQGDGPSSNISTMSKNMFMYTPAGVLAKGISEWWNSHKEQASVIKNEQASLLNNSLKVKEASVTSNTSHVKIEKPQPTNQNGSQISNINNKKNEIMTEKREIERQKLEAAKNATENKFDELVPIISKAIGLYFNSHSFKIENGELKTVYASNNAATRL